MTARRYEEIKALANDTALKVTRKAEAWMDFLNTAARLYRYNFDDQLLIYAQRPEASACASFDLWKDRMGCFVKRGSKGIALLDINSAYEKLRYVFDVSDVVPTKTGRLPEIWDKVKLYDSELLDSILNRLEELYGKTDEKLTFKDRLSETLFKIADDYLLDIKDEFHAAANDSYLSTIPSNVAEDHLRSLVRESLLYMVMQRSGLNFSSSLNEIEYRFSYIDQFHTVDLISLLGDAVSKLAEPVLKEIGRIVLKREKEISQNQERENGESEKINIARNQIAWYNQENSDDHISADQGADRRAYGTSIRTERGLSDTESGSERGTAGESVEVRSYEDALSGGEPERDIHGNEVEGDVENALSGGSKRSRGDGAAPDGTDEKEGGDSGLLEEHRSDALGARNELNQTQGGGDSKERTDLYLTPAFDPPDNSPYEQLELFASFSEQAGDLAIREAALSEEGNAASSFGVQRIDDNIIDSILRTGGGRNDSRKRIFAQYVEGKSPQEIATFLRQEYGTIGKGFIFDNDHYAMWSDTLDISGLRISKGSSAKGADARVLSWEEVEKRIRAMVENGTFISRTEAYLVPATESSRIGNDLANLLRDGLTGRESDIGIEYDGGFPDLLSQITSLLSNSSGRGDIISFLKTISDELSSGKIELRWRYLRHPLGIQKEIEDLGSLYEPKNEYVLPEDVLIKKESFITQDEIDFVFTGGSGFQNGKFRIYEYYQEEHTEKEAAEFLKKEYGTGGRSNALPGRNSSWEDHSAKGVVLKKGNLMEPFAEVTFTWKQVEKRIRELISSDHFFNEVEKEQYEEWKRVKFEFELAEAQKEMVNDDTDLEFGYLGNGITVWDTTRFDEDTNDYKTVAHVQPWGEVKYYSEDILESEKERIEKEAIDAAHTFIKDNVQLGEVTKYEYGEEIDKTRGEEVLLSATIAAYIDNEPHVISYQYDKDGIKIDGDFFPGQNYDIAEMCEKVLPLRLALIESIEKRIALKREVIEKEEQQEKEVDTWNELSDSIPELNIEDTINDSIQEEINESARPAVGKFSLYQINETSDLGEHMFESHEWMRRQGLNLSIDKYDSVYMADVGILHGEAKTMGQQMEMIFTKFNIDRPEDFTGHSLSMSDVIVFHEESGDRAFYVDTIGFREITEEFYRDRQQKLSEMDEIAADIDRFAYENDPYSYQDEVEDREVNVQQIKEMLEKRQEGDYRAYLKGFIDESEDKDTVVEAERILARLDALREKTPEQEITEVVAEEPLAMREVVEDHILKESDIDRTSAKNFRITDNDLGAGGAKEKFKNNLQAIHLLKMLEQENRNATPEEQEILSRYVGWGGLSDAFDESKAAWASEYLTLKGALTDEEYRNARASTLSAHFTSPTVINAVYAALEKFGFRSGNILEPSCGVGNFFGLLPESMSDSKLYGVELDSITARIAKKLYPEANIIEGGFEQTEKKDFYDVAIGNVPFGDYKVNDRAYNKLGFNIHNYFFAKALDQVRPGGIVAFVTTRYTMDSASPEVRKYLAQRAELLGAIRLPNTAFKANAGTEVVSDIIFLKKRDHAIELDEDWIHRGQTESGFKINSYFVDHPNMVLGIESSDSTQYGRDDYTVKPRTDATLSELLNYAVSELDGRIGDMPIIETNHLEIDDIEDDGSVAADPEVRNYSYCERDGRIYYREDSLMRPVEASDMVLQRIRGMIGIRDCTRELIRMQLEEYPEEQIILQRQKLNELYDAYVKDFGLLTSSPNSRAFNNDDSYCLLCSLEDIDEEGQFNGKAAMFFKRTIKRAEVVTSVDTPSEALAISLSEKACVDLPYMTTLCNKTEDEIITELSGVIFKNPITESWETADEYLSGNVREKLAVARNYYENDPSYAVNVQSLELVQPEDLSASDIEVRLGATWIDPKYIEQFMRDVLQTPSYLFTRNVIGVHYAQVTGAWNVSGKNSDFGNVLIDTKFGTKRANAYKILEDSLNLRDTRVYDTVVRDGKEKRELNKKETALASQAQEALREAFRSWIFSDQERRETLVGLYNNLFNSIRPREYSGSHLKFPGMSPEETLKPHQLNGVAHILYGDNTLLAHCVGAGKTWTMAAAAMEGRRLGLARKNLFVVPNHLTVQWASEFLKLYPGANILAATKRDFEPANRKKFCSRIATGDYDAIIIGHTQFEKIPLSAERQIAMIEKQIEDIETEIALMKAERGERYTIKQMEKSRKSLETRLAKLNDNKRKDSVITFEELGIDRLFVDESHSFKNLFLYTKMRNVAGIAQTEAQKSTDMFNKCRYLDEITGGKGVTFATGTPISNSMTELYTNMRYLQYHTLERMHLVQFDAWASSYGETQTAIELAPEGTGYRAKTRFARFYNLPELISLFKESADIQTSGMLDLDIPAVEYENVVLKPSEAQKEMVQSLADRAEKVRNKQVDSSTDNMLKITNDGRKLALDQRLINPLLPDDENSKANACVEKAFQIYKDTEETKSAQLIFCDLSTPKGDGSFSVYEDIRDKLMKKGVSEKEIAFVHDANTDQRKADLFAKVRSGQVRFLLGSTQKMGAGTNVQTRLIALHHLDVPWRPSDIEQQEGRILRQGNENPRVRIFRYITEGTFDAYSWQLIENKQRFISQIMTSKSPVRSAEDIDEASLNYAEVKALATGNPLIKEKMDLDIQVAKLKLLKSNYVNQKYMLEDNIAKRYPEEIARLGGFIKGLRKDIETYNKEKPKKTVEGKQEDFHMIVAGSSYEDKKEAGAALINVCRELSLSTPSVECGEYCEMKMFIEFKPFQKEFELTLKGSASHKITLGSDALGNIVRINNVLDGMGSRLEDAIRRLENTRKQLETAKIEVQKPFEKESEFNEKLARLSAVNALLDMDEKGEDVLDVEIAEEQEEIKNGSEVENGIEDGSVLKKLDSFREKNEERTEESVKEKDKDRDAR